MPRIVSLVPSLTAALMDLGREECVVGRTRFCPLGEDPDPVLVGGTKDPDLTTVVGLGPDVVLCVKEENREEDVRALRAAGLEVAVFEPRRVEEGPALAWSLGRLAGAEAEGMRIAGELNGAIRAARERAAGRHRLRTAYLLWREPWMVAGTETWIGDVLRTVGMDPVFPGRYPEVAPEDVVAAGVELILFSDEPFPFKKAHLAEFRERAGLAEGTGPRLALCRGDLVGWYPTRAAAAFTHLELLGFGSA